MSRTSRIVFVGNIPYDVTEEQLTEIFQEVGPVVAFRLVFDKETGKPKGYGFCEYHDAETAASAVRNLHNYEINGRGLRVDFSESDLMDRDPRDSRGATHDPRTHDPRMAGADPRMMTDPRMGGADPRMVVGMDPRMAGPDPRMGHGMPSNNLDVAINMALDRFSQDSLVEVISQMKMVAVNNPDQARNVLMQNPQLTPRYALFQILLLTNMVDPNVVKHAMGGMGRPPMGMPPPPMGMPPAPMGMPPVGYPPQMPAGQMPPPPMLPSGLQLPGGPMTEAQKQQMIMTLVNTPQAQIDALPPAQRQQIMALKQQLGQ